MIVYRRFSLYSLFFYTHMQDGCCIEKFPQFTLNFAVQQPSKGSVSRDKTGFYAYGGDISLLECVAYGIFVSSCVSCFQ